MFRAVEQFEQTVQRGTFHHTPQVLHTKVVCRLCECAELLNEIVELNHAFPGLQVLIDIDPIVTLEFEFADMTGPGIQVSLILLPVLGAMQIWFKIGIHVDRETPRAEIAWWSKVDEIRKIELLQIGTPDLCGQFLSD